MTVANDSITADLLGALDEMAPLVRDSAAEGDRLARLPKHIVRALTQRGLFRLWVPKSFGGFELGLPQALKVYERAASLDGSIGWAVMIGSGGGLFGAYLEPATAAAIFSPADAVIAGSGAPQGRARREKGGYRVTGCWRYASGAHYATTFTANCLITDDGAVVVGSDGRALIRAMAFEAPQVAILPVWDPTGMRGTGSDDFEVRDAFVPEHRTFSVFTDAPRETGPLYKLPFAVLTELPVTAVGVGIARHALNAFADLARGKTVRGTDQPLASDPVVRSRFAEAHATWLLAKSTLEALAQKAWKAARINQPQGPGEVAGETLTSVDLAEITAGCVFSVARLRAALGELMALAGMTTLQPDSELARAWRDLQGLAAHESVSPRHAATAGKTLLK